MTQSVCGELSIACIPMPGFNDTNVCSYAQPSCPFKTGVKETVTVPLPVSKSFPAVSVWVRVPPSMLLWSGTFLGEFWRFLETTCSDFIFSSMLLWTVSIWVRVPPSMLLRSGTSLGEFWKLPKSDLICQFSSTQCVALHVLITCLHRLQLRRLGGL